MSLLTTMLSTTGGGGSGSVQSVILLSALVGTTANLTVTQAGAGPGATLTNAGAQAAFSVDGVTPAVGSRVLVKDQSTASQNGVYTLTTAGSGATNWVLTRATDFNQPSQITVGLEIIVASGTVNAQTAWVQTATVNTVDTDSITFASMSLVGLTASRALTTNSAGKVIASSVTATELGYVSGVTSAIQTQFTGKVSQSTAEIYAADTGAADAYVVTLSPVPAGYTNGMTVRFKAANANTGASTINVNGLGSKNITKRFNVALVANDIVASQVVEIIYDGTQFQLQSAVGNAAVSSVSGTANQIDSTGGTNPVLSLSSTTVFPGTVTLNADPTTALEAVTKQYADALIAGLEFKNAAVAASTTGLTVTYSNGVSGVGATLTNAGAMAAFSLDGQSPSVGQRVLIKNQASTFQNGIYTVTTVGSGAVNWVLTRATDYDQASEIDPGDLIGVTAGTVNANTLWLQVATVAVIGTDAITFSQFSSAPLSLPVSGANGGTGVSNSGKTITLGGSLTTSGAFDSTFTMSNTTSVTFPVSGTLATTSQLNGGGAFFWIKASGDGSTINASFNVTSITDTGTGQLTINFTNSFSSSNYAAIGTLYTTNAGGAIVDTYFNSTTQATGSIEQDSVQENGNFADPVTGYFAAGFGS